MNNGLKGSWVIDDNSIPKLVRAAEFAYWRGYPLNRFLSVNCKQGGMDQSDARLFRIKLTKYICNWLRIRSIPWCAIWVLENPFISGLNFHLIFHIPGEHYGDFRKIYRRWLDRSGLPRLKEIADLQTLKDSETYIDPIDYIHKGLNGTLRYALKGCSAEVCEALGIERKDQGFIRGKRYGFSESIGPTARAEFIRRKRVKNPYFVLPRIVLRDVWPYTPPKPAQKRSRRTR